MRASRVFAAGLAVSVAALAAALVSQHVFEMRPCAWCVLQRLVFCAIGVVCAIGWAVSSRRAGRQAAATLVGLLALSGLAAAGWQHFVAARSGSCAMTLADRITSGWLQLDALLPDVFLPQASCADAAVSLFGLPYEAWSAALFALFAVAALRLLRAR